jgi:hypothetical protein
VVWVGENSPRDLTSSRISFDSLSLPYLIRSQVSIILTDGRLPGPSWFWWAPTSPLMLVVGIRLPKRRSDSTPYWHHQRIPWVHASYRGVSAATGTCHMVTHVTMGPQSISPLLTSAIPLFCHINNSGRASFQGPSQGRMAPFC